MASREEIEVQPKEEEEQEERRGASACLCIPPYRARWGGTSGGATTIGQQAVDRHGDRPIVLAGLARQCVFAALGNLARNVLDLKTKIARIRFKFLFKKLKIKKIHTDKHRSSDLVVVNGTQIEAVQTPCVPVNSVGGFVFVCISSSLPVF